MLSRILSLSALALMLSASALHAQAGFIEDDTAGFQTIYRLYDLRPCGGCPTSKGEDGRPVFSRRSPEQSPYGKMTNNPIILDTTLLTDTAALRLLLPGRDKKKPNHTMLQEGEDTLDAAFGFRMYDLGGCGCNPAALTPDPMGGNPYPFAADTPASLPPEKNEQLL